MHPLGWSVGRMAAVRAAGGWKWVHLASLLGMLAVLVYLCRGQWFFGDEWDFLALRGLTVAPFGLFHPHGEHWSTLPILWYRALFSVFGVRTYWPYLFGLFALHLLIVHCAWRHMLRAGESAGLATGVAVVIGLYGGGAENLTWAFQIGFLGSLAAGLLLLLSVDAEGDARRVALVAVGAIVSLMFSGISVVMVVAIGIAAFARWGWRRAAVATAPAALVYLAWLAWQGDVGLRGGNSQLHGGPADIPRYIWGGMSATLGELVNSHVSGKVLFVLLALVVATQARRWWYRCPELLALAAAAPLMFTVISQGRGALAGATTSRYLYLAAGMLFPLVGFVVQQVMTTPLPRLLACFAPTRVGNTPKVVAHTAPRREPLVLIVCVAIAIGGVVQVRNSAYRERNHELHIRGQILAALGVAQTEPTIARRPDPFFSPNLGMRVLQTMRDEGKLPSSRPTVADIAGARLALQVLVTRKRLPIELGATAPLPAGATAVRVGPACYDVDLRGTNAVITRQRDEAVYSITPSVSENATAFLPYPGGNAGPRPIPMIAGRPTTIRDALVAGPLVLQLPRGVSRLCGVAWLTG